MTSPNGTGDGRARGVLSDELRGTARAIVGKYPNPRSAVLPLLFLVQSVDGYVTEDGMREVGELLGLTSAEVLATASFYTMFKKRPQGEYLISVCRNISCTHMGARAVIAALEDKLGIGTGGTTDDGRFSLEAAECLATCDGAPSIQINYEDFYNVTPADVVALVDRLAAGEVVRSSRGEVVKTAREVALETATAGLRVPGTAGDIHGELFGGESALPMGAPGFRPKVMGTERIGGTGAAETEVQSGNDRGPSTRE